MITAMLIILFGLTVSVILGYAMYIAYLVIKATMSQEDM